MVSKTVSKKESKISQRTSAPIAGRYVSSASAAGKQRKHVVINQPRLKKAQELLGAKTESETIERALERVIDEAQRDKDVWAAHERFVKGLVKEDAEILDVFGRLEC